ncbi:MAG: FecR domain-containing protein [Trichocoleus desertorum ATA4-8-CV12]|nr:FecR domain-containing protein [Trichocoleus desertorum ATA4-8-CV12]
MSRKLALFLALMLSGVSIGGLAQPADAQTPLTRAVIQALRNRVRLMQKNRPVRSAQVSDAIAPGDALSTARASLAELRFNDGSLARVGEQAVFRFVPNARTFQLSNGTMLLLIPPGRGPTGVRTPNAAAGIKGSALFVRYIPDTDTTLVGALTNNPQGPMVIYNRDGSQSQGLRAGQLAVVVKNRIENVYDFDLNTFYETSDLVKGLNLTQKDSTTPSDEAIAAVRAETVEALQDQSPFKEANVVENPAFVRLPSDLADFPANNLDRVFNPVDVRQVVEAGEVQSEQTAVSSEENESSAGEMPVTGVTPPVTQPASGPATAAQGQPSPAQGQPSSGPTVSPLSPPAPETSIPTAPGVPAPPSNPSQPTVPATPVVPPAAQDPGRSPAPAPAPQPPVAPVVTQPAVPATPVVPPAAQDPGRSPAPAPAPQPPVAPVVTQPAVPATPVVPPAAQDPGRSPAPAPAPQPPVAPVVTQPTVPATPVVPPAAQDPGRPPSPQPPTQNPGPPIMIEPLPGGSVVPIDPTLPATPPTNPGPSNPPGPPVTDGPPVPPAPPVTDPPVTDGPPVPPGPPVTDVPPVPPGPPVTDVPPGPPVTDVPSVTDQPPNGGPANGGNFPGGGATEGNFPGGANGGNFPGRGPINR